MAYPQETRDKLRAAYVYDRLPLQAAAQRVGVQYATAKRWKTDAEELGDHWDRARNAARMAAGGLGDLTSRVIEDFVLLFESTIDDLKKLEEPNPMLVADAIARLADSYVKVMKAAGGGDRKLSELATAMKVLQSLTEFIRKHHPTDLLKFIEILEPFGQTLSTELQ